MKNGMRAIHPGEVIREDYLAELNMSAHALAQALHVPATRIHESSTSAAPLPQIRPCAWPACFPPPPSSG